jgi:hypothetical protein
LAGEDGFQAGADEDHCLSGAAGHAEGEEGVAGDDLVEVGDYFQVIGAPREA